MLRTTLCTLVHALLILGLLASPGFAQSPDLVDEAELKKGLDAKPEEAEEGWDGHLGVGATAATVRNDNVVGQPDGSTLTIGYTVSGGLSFLKGKQDLRGILALQGTFSRTPAIDEWVKTADNLHLEALYYFRMSEAFGPFGRAVLDAPLFSGFDIRALPVTYAAKSADGDLDTLATGVQRIQLTDPLRVMTVKESAGLFYRPVRDKRAELEFRAGFGAREVFADDALALADEAATPEIEVKRLESYNQAGLELAATVQGVVSEGRVTYTAGAEAMIPVVHDDPENRASLELMNVEAGGKLSFKLVSWASLDYEIKALKQPQLVDEWQLTNSLLLTFGYALIQ